MAISTFERIEQKYLIDEKQKNVLLSFLNNHMTLDEFCKNDTYYHIRNIYLDTDDDTLIRNSILKPVFKQKVRLRKYTGQKDMFIEVKLKYNGVVGKRRVSISETELTDWLNNHILPTRERYIDKQIVKEINEIIKQFPLRKKVFISYDRIGYFLKEDTNLRITIDDHLTYNREDLSWENQNGKPLLKSGQYVLEIKYNSNLPLWLTEELTKLNIQKITFSKYGKEHLLKMEEQKYA